MALINILMASYKGGEHLPAQLDSILGQTFQDFAVYIRDDASPDNTVDIIDFYAQNYPGKIRAIKNNIPSGSAKNNFFKLIEYPDYDGEYFMFCDQDDFWLPEKNQITLDEMRRAEAQTGKDKPILIHTDLEVVNQNLQTTARSFMKYQGLKPKQKSLSNLLVQNNITGCTVMVNRTLLELARLKCAEQTETRHHSGESSDLPQDAVIMHDGWLGLIAAAMGEIRFVDRQTIKYRQHGSNEVGAKNIYDLKYIMSQIKIKLRKKEKYASTCAQARLFYDIFGDRLDDQRRELLEKYISLPKKNKIGRWYYVIRYGFWMQGFSRKIAQLIFG